MSGSYSLEKPLQAAAQMARNAATSLPQQMGSWKEVKAMHRLLDEEDVTCEALMLPHIQQTRQAMVDHAVVLLVQDTTEIDLSHHLKTRGLGQVGNERGRGIFLQTVLAIVPSSHEVLGCLQQRPFVRVSAPVGESRDQRKRRTQRETDVWAKMVQACGSAPSPTRLVPWETVALIFFLFLLPVVQHRPIS